MNSLDVTFILPAYNVASYLEECVDSIEKQKLITYEIIIVDDGSKDDTLRVAEKLARRNSAIRVIHQENGGVSKARNVGLYAAAGEYIAFVDSDDFYIEDFVNDFLITAREYKLDLIRGQYRICEETELTDRGSKSFSTPDYVMSGKEFLKYSLREKNLEVVPYLGLFRRRYLIDNDISFPEGIGYEEDQIHLFQALLRSECRIVQKNIWFYAYRQHGASVTHNVKPKQIYDVVEVIKQEERELAKQRVSFKEQRFLRKYISASFYQITAIYPGLEKIDRKTVYRKIPKRMIINSILYPMRIRFAIKGIVFLVFPELLIKGGLYNGKER